MGANVLASAIGSGSYQEGDVVFLLKEVASPVIDVHEKEKLIQSGEKHYSEMISQEHAPSAVHKELYARAMVVNGHRMAHEVQSLAVAIKRIFNGPTIALVSFVRAGVPLGVLLRRSLIELGADCHHYGISIVRDRGIDTEALEFIIRTHGAENIVFVDGWTGKGAIAGELRRSLKGDTRFPADPPLVVLADPCGKAWLAASAEDWVIPSGILGATVSGLISRSIWPSEGGLHGCVRYDHLRSDDVSQTFIAQVQGARGALPSPAVLAPWTGAQQDSLQAAADNVISGLAERFGITNLNRIKPGIAEATRAVMRRVPERVLVHRKDDDDVKLLLHLTEQAGIDVEEAGSSLGPYRAVTIIRSVGK